MPLIKVLITVKSYPNLTSHYDEQLSIAGFTEDGTFIRIYPISFSRKAYDEQFQLYDWVEVDLVRNTQDFRLESFSPKSPDTPIKKIGHVGMKDYWEERKNIVLKRVYRNLSNLLMESKHEAFYTSLAVFKPQRIIGFEIEEETRDWNEEKLAKLQEEKNHMQGVENPENPFQIMKKLPYKFSFRFTDDKNQELVLPIEDWELASLYWKVLKKQNEQKAIMEVRKKYLEYIRHSDLHFFLGSTQNMHASIKQPFTIVGLFQPAVPPKVIQGSLF
ncbi:hypothetical protein DVR12_23780 [Chitinophaga silvatica]|uniref:Uncharacterized protein n=1 Tax=Chitinophaga silvatica TaxID=2282649 RepID=A0A3E1Y3J0_9BACT|nr:hypothetical protein [Chitinophaga silvatica]RFS19258.1 hypothetical protein DVR12_23780 [Chitinophaga silvatica]